MKDLQQLLDEVTRLTSNINTNYPDLYKFLSENPITIPSYVDPQITKQVMTDYLDSLKNLLHNHIESHKKKNASFNVISLKPFDIAVFSEAIRERTIKRLESVPQDFINWRLNNTSLSFGHIAQHIINADELFIKMVQSSTDLYIWVLGTEESHPILERHEYEEKIIHLKHLQKQRANLILTLTEKELTKTIHSDDGEEMILAWFILEKIIEHEVYHRGQISAYLKVIKGEL
ncbi:DinB family protein [Flavobacterium sp. Arc2]|uniref:DinB family protein n=1 Tax=Flavobacterium sp. Arc2 TaxID=3046685 RepID=UPI00352EC639